MNGNFPIILRRGFSVNEEAVDRLLQSARIGVKKGGNAGFTSPDITEITARPLLINKWRAFLLRKSRNQKENR